MRPMLTLANFNVLNLTLPGFKIYEDEVYTPQQYQQKTAWLGGMIDKLNADFIGFEEVWQLAALQEAGNHSQVGAHYRVFAPWADQADNALPRVALATRLPLITEPESIVNLPNEAAVILPGGEVWRTFSRPVLRAVVNVAAPQETPVPMTIFVTHLKSRRPDFLDGEDEHDPRLQAVASLRSHIKRLAEAAGLRLLVVDATLRNQHPLAVLGDFNDDYGSASNEMVSGRSSRDGLSRDVQLYSAYHIQSERGLRPWLRDVAYSHIFHGEPHVLDHCLVSEEFWRESKFALGDVFRVDYFNDHIADRLPTTSDHGAMRVILRFGAAAGLHPSQAVPQ